MKFSDILKAILQSIPFLFYLIITRPFYVYAYHFNRLTFFKACGFGLKLFLFYLRIKLSIYGTELFPKPGRKFLIVANHQSFIDIFIIESILPCAFIQRPVPYIPGFSWYFGKSSLIIDKESPLSILKAVRYAKQVAIDQGIPVALFPESTRSIDGRLGELQLGAATIAKTLNLPVLPVTIYNSKEIMPKGTIYAKPGVVLVAIQPLIEERFIKNHSVEELNHEIKQRIQKGLDYLGQVRQESL
ncbi:MAG: lysophospholipid acyltransferase family protein [Candidatus Margulisiibacteriota bacterium]